MVRGKLNGAIITKWRPAYMSNADGRENSSTVIRSAGKEYEIGLNGWLTLTDYCKRYELKSISVVMNWICRGIVADEHVVRIPELNNLCLVRDLDCRILKGVAEK